jgi:hypothetical protein
LLGITMETPLEVSTDGRSLVISPVPDARREGRVRVALRKVNRRHGETLRKLAE